MDDDSEQQGPRLLAPSPEDLALVQVFPVILCIKKDVLIEIDSAMSWDQLTAADINYTTVQPLVRKYARLSNPSVVYACFVVRSHFLALATKDLAHSNTMMTRAALCELLATKLARCYANNKVMLAAALTTSWRPTAGAPVEVALEIQDSVGGSEEDMEDSNCALELAIHTNSKRFLENTVVQTVVNDIYAGRIVYSTPSRSTVLADNYKPQALRFYDVRNAPFLDHYRLRVPRYNALLEFLNFALLMITFCLCLSHQNYDKLGTYEIVFIVFAVGFILDEYAQAREHGWSIYIAHSWNVFDASFLVICLAYFALRANGLIQHDRSSSILSFDILACGACILFPRLAFFAIKNNVVVLALRGMIADFIFFMGIASVCFSGMLFTLWTLAKNKWQLKSIVWLMVQIWFGNTTVSFQEASSFHKFLGPVLIITFAILCDYLLLTILLAILSNTFARIDSNATQEYLFQFTVGTIEGSKSDALFSYQPPFNILAFAILLPASWVLSPRKLHSLNVFLIKSTSFPLLIAIGIYERFFAQHEDIDEDSRRRSVLQSMPFINAIVGGHNTTVYEAIFDVALSEDQEEAMYRQFDDFDDELRSKAVLRSVSSMENFSASPLRRIASRSRTRSPMKRDKSPVGGQAALIPDSPTPIRRPRRQETLRLRVNSEVAEPGGDSPSKPMSRLARLFGAPRLAVSASDNTMNSVMLSPPVSDEALAGIRRLETVLEGVRDMQNMPVQRLKEEIKDIQDRQARIETLLLTLTRGMRHEPLHQHPRRDQTI